jgi:hypothetical protein
MSNLSDKSLQVAISQLGKEEVPRGSNWGEPVRTYLKTVGITFPASWCMALIYWCFNEASKQLGVINPLIKTGGVLNHYNKAPKFRVLSPQVGDIFIMDFGNGTGHTGIIESVEGDVIHTIEGNTNDEGSREGYEVCRRTRKKSTIKGYLRY